MKDGDGRLNFGRVFLDRQLKGEMVASQEHFCLNLRFCDPPTTGKKCLADTLVVDANVCESQKAR